MKMNYQGTKSAFVAHSYMHGEKDTQKSFCDRISNQKLPRLNFEFFFFFFFGPLLLFSAKSKKRIILFGIHALEQKGLVVIFFKSGRCREGKRERDL